MNDFISIVRGDGIVSDEDAHFAFSILGSILVAAPTDVDAIDAASSTIARMHVDSDLAAYLDWWLLVTTGTSTPHGRAFHLPDAIPHTVRVAMDELSNLENQGLSVAPVEWVRCSRQLLQLLDQLDDDLSLDSYGKSRLPKEREAWSHLQMELQDTVHALRAGTRAAQFEFDQRGFEKELKRGAITENSRRWVEMVKRAHECVDRVNRVVDAQHVAQPWVQRARPAVIEEIPLEAIEQLGPLAELVLEPIVSPDPVRATQLRGEDGFADQLEELARAIEGSDRAWLASVADDWLEQSDQDVPSLRSVIDQRVELERRMSALKEAGVDTDEAEVCLLDFDLVAAAAAIADLENLRRRGRRAEALSASIERFRVEVSDADAPGDLPERIRQAREMLDRDDLPGAETLLQEVDQALRAARHATAVVELSLLRDELESFGAPAGALTEIDEQLRSAEPDSSAHIDSALVGRSRERLDALRYQRIDELAGHLRAAHEMLEIDRDLIPEEAQPELELRLAEAERALERDELMEAVRLSAELLADIEGQRVHRWTADEGEEALLDHVINYCTQQLHFDPEDVKRLYVACKTKPFVILAGLTGSGKSTIARLFAGALGADVRNGRYRRVAVRPDWIDQAEVIGSINPLSNNFEPGWLAELALQCERNADQIHVVLLDEMNLAPVEQYLAEYLSAIEESRSGSDGTVVPLYSAGATPENGNEWPPALPFPRNLIVIGTVNVDETTRAMSERVLDRANVLQLSAAISDAHHRPRSRSVQPWYVPFPQWDSLCKEAPDAAHHDFLVEIGEILQSVGIGVGQRSHTELERFVANARGVLDPVTSLDLGILQRIIPKVRGFKRDLEVGLSELSEALASAGCDRSAAVIDQWLDPAVSDDEFLDGTDARIGLLR